MTFDEAAAHLNLPVRLRTAPGRAVDAQIVAVNRERRMVGLRVRYVVLARGWRPGIQWWHPCHLDLPRWWLDRQEAS